MHKTKILSLEDLYNYYSSTSKRSRHFSAKDENTNIVVQVPGNILFEKQDDSKEGLTPVVLQACHIGINRNMSKIDQSVMEKALPSFSNRPILGYIYEVDGEWQFYDHRMHMDEDDEIVYDEQPIGIIPESCNAHLEYDKEKDQTYVVVSGYLFDEYSKASEIMEREKECFCSVELSIRELSFDAKAKVLNIEDFYFSGVTALGVTPNGDIVEPGMSGANIQLADFQLQSKFSQDNVIVMLNEINEKIDQLSINIKRKEENQMEFEENVEVTETSEEETVFEESTEEPEKVVEEAAAEESNEEVTATEAESEETDDPVAPSEEEKFTKTFEISHDDIRCALYALLAPYENEDNDWYAITAVYDNYFIYEGWFNGDNKYRQEYKVDGDNVSFDGERIHVNVKYLTDSELISLNEMRSNYATIEKELNLYKAEPEKIELLQSEEYSQIKETDEYSELAKRENYFELNKEDLTKKLDDILLAYAKQNKLDFTKSDSEKKEINMKRLPIQKAKKSGRYGSIFTKN